MDETLDRQRTHTCQEVENFLLALSDGWKRARARRDERTEMEVRGWMCVCVCLTANLRVEGCAKESERAKSLPVFTVTGMSENIHVLIFESWNSLTGYGCVHIHIHWHIIIVPSSAENEFYEHTPEKIMNPFFSKMR